MNKNTFLNDYAVRCFRDTADMEYILARIAHRLEFFGQYHWHGLHAIEKYIKSILLFNRISSKKMGQDQDSIRLKKSSVQKILPKDITTNNFIIFA